MGRALVREPKAFLLDEPLSNLDAKLRVQMRAELKRIHQRLGITTVYVTHDQVEAMTLGDRIVVMSGGKALQIGRPQDVYRRPANLFVAGFIGSPAMNLVRGTASDGGVVAGELRFPWPSPPAGELAVGIRPECLTPADDGRPSFELRVDVVEPLGEQVVVHGTVAGTPGAQRRRGAGRDPPARRGRAGADDGDLRGRRTEPSPGDVLRLGVAPDRIHLFDLQSGDAIPGFAG